MRGYKEFYSTLLSGPSAGSLLKIFLPRSFEEQWSWYAEDGWCYVNAPDGVRNAGINDMKVFKYMVMESWPDGIQSVGEKIWLVKKQGVSGSKNRCLFSFVSADRSKRTVKPAAPPDR